MKVLFACSEAYPFIKTGGLADVAGSLPRALAQLGCQMRLLLPAYASVLQKIGQQGLKKIYAGEFAGEPLVIWQTRLPGSRALVWLVDVAAFSRREGNPYTGPDGADWPDNAECFYRFCQVAAALAQDQLGLGWRADVVHANDWQTGLIPALLRNAPRRPRCIFTIHNLAYRGLFPKETFMALNMPWEWWRMDGVEFYDQFSFLKGGLAWADIITTVSPSYAEEIQTPAFGCGLEGLLQYRRAALTGIVNGIDTAEWNPGTDRHLAAPYNRRSLSKKAVNKQALQDTFGLPQLDTLPLVSFIGRLVEQKGVTLMLEALPALLAEKACQFVVLGSGETTLEKSLLDLSARYPEQMQVRIGYDESLSHQIEAGSDIFLMPSLFEPCGLNQLYSQRYGTVPLAHYVGGLRDTIINLSPAYSAGVNALEVSDETGFLFAGASAMALDEKLRFALACFENKSLWRRLQMNGMSQDFSWKRSAAEYQALYQSA